MPWAPVKHQTLLNWEHISRPGTGASPGPRSQNTRGLPKTSGTSDQSAELSPLACWTVPGMKGSADVETVFVRPRRGGGGAFLFLQPVSDHLCLPPDDKTTQVPNQPTCHSCLHARTKVMPAVDSLIIFFFSSGCFLYWLGIKCSVLHWTCCHSVLVLIVILSLLAPLKTSEIQLHWLLKCYLYPDVLIR